MAATTDSASNRATVSATPDTTMPRTEAALRSVTIAVVQDTAWNQMSASAGRVTSYVWWRVNNLANQFVMMDVPTGYAQDRINVRAMKDT